MATPNTTVRPTAFPRFDTRDHTQDRTGDVINIDYKRRDFEYAAKDIPKGKTALLQGYCRFIAAFTGEYEPSFECALRYDTQAQPRREVVSAEVLGEDSEDLSNDVLLEIKHDVTTIERVGFGFELLVDPEDFDTLNTRPVLDCSFVVQYHVSQQRAVIYYDGSLLDEDFANTAFDVLIRNLSRSAPTGLSAASISVLNHPPTQRPPPLPHGEYAGDSPTLLHGGFQRTAVKYPTRTALHFGSEVSGTSKEYLLSYSELDSLTSALAVKLRSLVQAVKPPEGRQNIIPAYMANSPAFYVSWLAVLKAGYAFAPLPMDAPPEQLRGIVEEVGASLILCNGPQVGGRPWDAWYCDDDELATCLDVAAFITHYQDGSNSPIPVVDALPSIIETDLAYVMYTSGSTGKPKGVRIHHLAAACSIASHCKFIPASFFRDGFRWFQFAAPTFDPSIMEIFTTWWTGGTLCGAPREELLTDPEAAINKLGATIMMATPSMASVLRPERVPTLRTLWTMGEKLTPKVIRNFSSDSPLHASEASHVPRLQKPYRLLNFYGPTETSINCNVVSDFSAHERGSIIGKAIDTCSILILDANTKRPIPVPLGFSGELAIGGPQVSQGYLNRPDQTAAAFVTSPEYGRLYRTGDRARIVKSRQGDLTVEFLGRLTTDQVKLSGRRVELGQIESVIAAVNGVSDVVAIVHSQGGAGQGSEQVVACVVRDGTVQETELLSACRQAAESTLASFMRPASYILLDSMPRSRSGKTDRKALQVLANEQSFTSAQDSLQGSHHGSGSPVKDRDLALVVDALSDVCGVGRNDIAPSTDLLSIGLDSLRAVRFLQRIRDEGITNLSVATLLSSRTVEGIAKHCAQSGEDQSIDRDACDRRLDTFSQQHHAQCAQQLGLDAQEVEAVLPTTATQSGMIASFLRSTSRGSERALRKRYINHSIYHQAHGVDHSKLDSAWKSALSGPRILRTVFVPVDDNLSPFGQCILSASSSAAQLQVVLYETKADDWSDTIQKAESDAEAAIELDRPPFRLSVIQSSERRTYLLSLFHGIFDGGSLELILRDVENAYLDRPSAPRTEVDVPVRKHFTEATEATRQYWKSQYQDFELVPFPCVSASKAEKMSPSAQVTEVIGNVTLEKLSAASRTASVSPLSILQAAWATILFAYSGSTAEVSFGSVLSDRLEDELSSCHAPTFVVAPVKLSRAHTSDKSVRDVLSYLTDRNAEALPHHHIPLSGLTTSDGSLPYDTLLAFQAFDKSAGDSSIWSKAEYPPMEHDFAVMIEIWPTRTGALRLRATYTHAHLDEAGATVMLQQLDELVNQLCEQPAMTFSQAPYAVSKYLRSEYPAVSCNDLDKSQLLLHCAFEKHAADHPNTTALLFKRSLDGSIADIDWSFGRLSSLADGFATRLLKAFGPIDNQPVMICMEKCPELYIAVLGILKAGTGWCPIDPYSPPARQHAIMERTGSKILILSPTSSKVDPTAIPGGVSTVDIDLAALEASTEASELSTFAVKRDPSHLAYLIFTSGTTGLPKGVPITHQAGATAMHALAKEVPSDTSTGELRCMQFSQYTFDVFVQDLFYTWTLGGTVISGTRELMLQNFAELANQTRATHAHLTPAFSATVSRDKIKTLEVVTMIGEKLTEAVAEDWGTNMRAFNTYGPAEVTVVSTLRQFSGKKDKYHSSNIGVPLPSVGAYVLDNGNVVMRGSIGELALAGSQLSPGYWKLPEVNAKKFIWNEQLQQKVYLTGDLVRHLADGTINYIGRDDDLVKLGGQRVELGEIAFALKNADPRIEKFEVLLCQRKDGTGKSVVAFLSAPSVCDGEQKVEALLSPTAKELARGAKDYASSVLPPYMIPSSFLVLPRIPRTASAKVDRAKLTSIYHSLDLAEWENVESSTGVAAKDQDAQWRKDNETLLDTIAQILGMPKESLRPNSSLPAIGLDSIGAIRLIPKINALGFNLSVVDAFKCRTLNDLCHLTGLTRAKQLPEKVENNEQHPDKILLSFDARYYKQVAQHIGEDDFTVIPTTVLQESLLAESLKDPRAYWSSHLFELACGTDVNRLKRAWIKLARQAESLRAGFLPKAAVASNDNGRDSDNLSYVQIIYDEPQLAWTEQRASGSIEDTARQRVSEIAEHHHSSLFRHPPWAVDIIRKDSRAVMMLTISHVIYDGASLPFVEDDLRAAYERSPKAATRLPLREAIALRSALHADSPESLAFWKNSLQDFDTEAGATEQGLVEGMKLKHRVQFSRSAIPLRQLREAASKLGLSSIVTFYRTAWALVLNDILESPHVIFAEIVSDRVMDSKLEDVIGPLVSTVPSLFRRKEMVSETLLEHDNFSKQAWGHRNIRPGTIKSLLGREASSQVYPAVFAFHPGGSASNHDDNPHWKRLQDIANIKVEHPLAFNVSQDSGDAPTFELAIAEHIMSEDEQRLLLKQLDALVGALTQASKASLASLTDGFSTELVSRSTPRKDTKAPSDKSTTYYVEHWAKTHPDWKAVEVVTKMDEIEGNEIESWTYAELNAEANRIANYILEQGVTKQTIGMCIGRTLMSYAVPLGILKSGNCYLPIDEALPADRKAFLLEDSSSAFVLTELDFFSGVDIPSGCKSIDVRSPEFTEKLSTMSTDDIPRHGGPRDNAYLLYTSGSTGKPKGVLVNKENLASFVEAQSEFICEVTNTRQVAGRGRWLGLASRAFDVHIGEMFLSWAHGLSVTTGLKSMLLDDLALCLTSLHITHAAFVPSLLDQTGLTPEDAPDLVYMGVGGEKMSPKTKKLWGSSERIGLINAYGPTEATIGLNSCHLLPETDIRDIGSPLGDSVAHILVPGTEHYALRGMPGELCYTGSLIANGYLNRPDAKGFVEDFHGKRMYRTGDIVKLTINDRVIFLGRKDDQVKIRGQRVELGEVAEGVRIASDRPLDTVALVVKHPELSRQQLVAFVTEAGASKRKGHDTLPEIVQSDLEYASTTLRANCQKILPAYMVPDLTIPLTYIPLAPTSGKADNKLLVKVFSSTPMSELMSGRQEGTGKSDIDRPMTDTEQSIWKIISSVLKGKPAYVTPSTTVFELGIDSLSAITVFSRLRAAGYQCSVAMVMKNPTLEQLAQSPKRINTEDSQKSSQVKQYLAPIEQTLTKSGDLAVDPESVAAIRPTLPIQEILVGQSMHQNMDGSEGAYVNHITFQLSSEIDVDRLRDAWLTLAHNNEILRTCFGASDDKFYQVVLKADHCPLLWETKAFQPSMTLGSIQTQVAQEMVRDIWSKPPLRLSHLPDHGNTLLLSIHHAIYDGRSLAIMMEDLENLYHARVPVARPSSQPLVEYIAALDMDRAKGHWQSLLHDWQNAPLLSESATQNVTLVEKQRRISSDLSTLESQAVALNTTLSTVLQAAFALALCQTLQTNDFIFGHVLSGRTIPVDHAENIMAPCIATVPQRLKIPDVKAPLSEALSALQQNASASLEFQHTSPRQIQRWSEADRPLYDCLFSFNRVVEKLEDGGRLLKQVESQIAVDYPLAVEIEANSTTGQVIIGAGFTEAFGSESDAEILLERIEVLVEAICERPSSSVESFGISAPSKSQAMSKAKQFDESRWTPLEQELKSLLSQYTGATEAEIRKDTAFIHLGIDSISAIRFAKHIRSKGHKVSSADVIRHSRLGSLCQFLEQRDGVRKPNGVPPPEQPERRSDSTSEIKAILAKRGIPDLEQAVECYECTPLQAGMLAQSLATEGALYMHHHAFRCDATLNLDRLKEAWEELVDDLDVLRTTFHWVPEHTVPWLAVVRSDKRPEWHEIEVPDAKQHWLHLSEKSDFTSRIEKVQPLAGVEVVKSTEAPVVILTLHHAIYDGISIGMLFSRLAMHYAGASTPEVTPFYEAAWSIARTAKSAVQFWEDHVRGYGGAPKVSDDGQEDHALAERIVTADAAAIEAQSTQADMDLKDVCIAAFGKAMAQLHGRRDVVFGHIMAARNGEIGEGNDVVGPMFNTVPFRVALRDTLTTNQEMVRKVHEVNMASLEYQHASLADIQKAWRETAAHPTASLIDSLFVYSKIETDGSEDTFSLGQPLDAEKAPVPSEYRLNVEVEHTPKSLIARASSSLPKEDLEALLDTFVGAIDDILYKPGRYATAYPEGLRALPIETKTTSENDDAFDEEAVAQYADIVRQAMADVAQVQPEKIALKSSIYSFGIDSIAGIQIASRCRKAGVRVSVADILKGGTLGRICEIMRTKAGKSAAQQSKVVNGIATLISPSEEDTALAMLRLKKDVVEEIMPCLPGQEYHLLSWLQSGRTLYEPGWSYRSSIRLDANRLKESWRVLRKRNMALRTTFAATRPDKIVQVTLRPGTMGDEAFSVHETSVPVLVGVKERAHVEAQAPSNFFDLPVRLRLIKAADGDAIMVYVHHALYDAWTMPRLVSELANIYNERQLDSAPSFSDLIHHTFSSRDPEEERKFWSESLANGQKAILPSASSPADELDRRQNFHMMEGSRVRVADLEQVCSVHGVSPHHVVLLAFARALASATDTSSPLFGFFQLGRSAAFDGIDRVTGPCVNALPMALQSVHQSSVLESLEKLQRLMGARVPHEQSSLRTAVLAHDPSASQSPFNAYINLLWNRTALIGSPAEADMFKPLALGVPTDYSSSQALPGQSAVDALDTSFLPPHQLFIDVGPGESGIAFGARADAALMGIDDIRRFIESVEGEVVACVEEMEIGRPQA